MRIITQKESAMDTIVEELQSGATIVYPTETCYGLGCDATNAAAVARIFAIKKRQSEKSLLLLMSDQAMARQYVEWNAVIDCLAKKYWPGPLTIVAPLKRGMDLPPGVVAFDGTIAFRISGHPFAAEMCRHLAKPIVSTSANISAKESPYDIASVLSMFGAVEDQPDMIIDAGALPQRSPSTIVRIRGARLEIVRQGDIIIEGVHEV